MRFDPGKAWPHPVLRPPRYGDDYPYAEFEVEIQVKRTLGSTAVEVTARFELSDPDLQKLIRNGVARYVVLIKASKTHYRGLIKTSEIYIRKQFDQGELSGRVEFAPFLVCTQELPEFRADGWHADFDGLTFDIPAGAVLAEDIPKDYWVDTADETPLGSIFGHKTNTNLSDGKWECELLEDRVWIVMSQSDTDRYRLARNTMNNQPEGQYLMNGLYLPALLTVLNETDKNPEEYRNFRWFSSLDQRLQAVGCSPLGSNDYNRLIDAQKVLESPFSKMPMIAKADVSEL